MTVLERLGWFRCTKCGRLRWRGAFRPNAKLHRGRDSWCIDCHRASTRRWRAIHRDEENARRRQAPVARECADPTCGKTFEGRADRLYCSDRCRGRVAERLRWQRHPEREAQKQRAKRRRRRERDQEDGE